MRGGIWPVSLDGTAGEPRGQPERASPLRDARLFRDARHPAQARARHQRLRTRRIASRTSRWSASRSSSATGRRNAGIRSAGTSRSRSAIAWSSAWSATSGCAASSAQRAAGLPVVEAGRRRLDHRLHPAKRCVVRPTMPPGGAAPRRSARSSAAIDPTLPVSDVAHADRRRRARHRVASGAGARARRVRGDRVRARRHRHPRPAVVRRVAAHAGDRRAHGARRAVGRHPARWCCGGASCWRVAGVVPGVAARLRRRPQHGGAAGRRRAGRRRRRWPRPSVWRR